MIIIKKLKVSTLIIIDFLCICLGFGLFCLFHFVIDFSNDPEPVSIISSEPQTNPVQVSVPESPAVTGTEAPGQNTEAEPAEPAEPLEPAEPDPAEPEEPSEPEESAEPAEPVRNTSGMFGEKFADKFTDGEIIQTDDSYQSANINVTVSHYSKKGVIYNIAEIYIRDIKYFKTAFGGEGFKKHTEDLPDLAARHKAVIAISGDHYGARAKGVVVRNGVLYRNTKFEDIGILTDKGELITMPASKYDSKYLKEYGAWQVWCFGPELLDNGNVKTKFNSSVTRANPRTAIGCVEPGHYFFVVIDGRIETSKGLTMEQLSKLFYELGCTSAYNLDGGQTSGFCWNGSLLSYPYGRPVWDMIYIGEDE